MSMIGLYLGMAGALIAVLSWDPRVMAFTIICLCLNILLTIGTRP